MTDKELTEIIATKVMGWEENGFSKRIEDKIWRGDYRTRIHFDPLTSDTDCMMAWDKLMQMWTDNTRIIKDTGLFRGKILAMFTQLHGSDRRRTMCECMATVTMEGKG